MSENEDHGKRRDVHVERAAQHLLSLSRQLLFNHVSSRYPLKRDALRTSNHKHVSGRRTGKGIQFAAAGPAGHESCSKPENDALSFQGK